MLIKSLRMKNFRQFKGETVLEFSCDPERNVTIILGDNTFGKTTLLQAFNWCLYGKATLDEPNFLLNKEIMLEMCNGETHTVAVELVIINESVEYLITRTQRYKCVGDRVNSESVPKAKVSYKEFDGQMQAVKALEVDKVIDKILPRDLSNYFFFDTERINTISNRRDVTEAVKGLLGLSSMENAIKHLGNRNKRTSVIGKLYNGLDLEGNSQAEKFRDQMATNESKREAIAEQLKTCKEQIKDYESRLEQLNDILRDSREVSELQKKRDNLERWIKTEKITLTDCINRYFKEFNEGALAFFAQPLVKEALDILEDAKLDDKGVSDVTRKTIMELLERGKCLCGREICVGNEAYENLRAELAYVPPESIGNAVRNYRQELENFSGNAQHTYERIDEQLKAIMRLKDRIGDWEQELDEISDKLKDNRDITRFEVELFDIKKRLRDLNNKKDTLNRTDGIVDEDIKRCRKRLDSFASTSDNNKKLAKYIAYAERIRSWLEENYKEREALIRDELESEVNKMFEKMYHGHRRVQIDSGYQVTLLTGMGNAQEIVSGESEGLNRVKNFAFIAGLVSLAKRKLLEERNNDELHITSEPFPLVMDAPFSNADETHTTNISKVLPEVAEQIIMFVMQKDWNYAERVIDNRVGRRYRLNKITETFTQVS